VVEPYADEETCLKYAQILEQQTESPHRFGDDITIAFNEGFVEPRENPGRASDVEGRKSAIVNHNNS
jgi:hypothetical protein